MNGCVPIEANQYYPGIPKDITGELSIELSAIGECKIAQVNEIQSRCAATDWIIQQLQERLENPTVREDENNLDQMIELLQLFHAQLHAQTQDKLKSHVSLSNQSAAQLFRYLEQEGGDSSNLISDQSNTHDDLAECISLIKAQSISDTVIPNNQSTNPRTNLQQLLERNGLIGREVIITEDKLEQNCGDLIAFSERKKRHQHYYKRKGLLAMDAIENAASTTNPTL